MVEIRAVPARVDHCVDRRTAAEAFAAGLVAPPTTKAGLRRGLKMPVAEGRRHRNQQRRWHLDVPMVVAVPRLEKDDAQGRVFREPPREDAASRSASNDDDIGDASVLGGCSLAH